MQLHLIRHGESNWNEERRIQGQSESILTDLGIQQAQVMGERMYVSCILTRCFAAPV